MSTESVGVSLSTKLVGVYPVDLPQQATATSQPTNPNQTISQPYLNPISTLSPTLSPNPILPTVAPKPGAPTIAPGNGAQPVAPFCGATLRRRPAAPLCCATLLHHRAAPLCGSALWHTLRQCPAVAPCGGGLVQPTVAAPCAAGCGGALRGTNRGHQHWRGVPPPSARGELWM